MAFPTPDATTGMYAAAIAGIFGIIRWGLNRWVSRHGEPPVRKTAWQRQAETLRNEVRGMSKDQIARLERQIDRLEQQHSEDAAEIRRLNRLLNRERSDDD